MYGLEYRTGHVRCSFCGCEGHNITSCKHVERVYNNTQYNVITYPDGTPLPDECHPSQKVDGWIRLSSQSRKAFVEMDNRKRRAKKRSAANSKRKKPRCSFCRKEGHRRPSCKHKSKFAKTVYKANSIWRTEFVKFINKLGMGIGALVRVPRGTFYWDNTSDILLCMITDYSFDKMHVFCSYGHRDDYRASPFMTLTDTLTNIDYKLHFDKIKAFNNSPLIHSRGWGTQFVDVISPNKWSPSDDWINTKHNTELEFMINKISTEDHAFANVYTHINAWNKGE